MWEGGLPGAVVQLWAQSSVRLVDVLCQAGLRVRWSLSPCGLHSATTRAQLVQQDLARRPVHGPSPSSHLHPQNACHRRWSQVHDCCFPEAPLHALHPVPAESTLVSSQRLALQFCCAEHMTALSLLNQGLNLCWRVHGSHRESPLLTLCPYGLMCHSPDPPSACPGDTRSSLSLSSKRCHNYGMRKKAQASRLGET